MKGRDFEQLEGEFHDGLGTFNERNLINHLIEALSLPQAELDLTSEQIKMKRAVDRLPLSDPRRWALLAELENIRSAAPALMRLIDGVARLSDVAQVEHVGSSYAGGKAADVLLLMRDGSSVPLSLKTDKSNKIALADVGQTPIERVAQHLYDTPVEELEHIAQRSIGMGVAEAKADYQDVAHLMQHLVRTKLGVVDGGINNMGSCRPTDDTAVQKLFANIQRFAHGVDKAVVLVTNRVTGRVGFSALIGAIDPTTVRAHEISFSPCAPKSIGPPKYRFGTTIAIKWRGEKLFDHQVKHQRGAQPSVRFRDVTTRLALGPA